MEPQFISQFFHRDIMYLIRKRIEFMKSGHYQGVEENFLFNRLEKHTDDLLTDIHHMINGRVCNLLGFPVKPSYNFTSMYFEGKGICPKHVDRPPCQYTLDICVNQNEPWAINIADKDYFMGKGDAMLYSGTGHVHYRERIQPNNYCDLVFFHFVPVDFTGPLD